MSDAAYKRVAKLFPMLSSSADGEVANAARAMTKVLKEAGLHWTDVAKRIVDGAPPFTDAQDAKPGNSKGFRRDREAENAFRKPNRGTTNDDNGPRRRPSAWAQDKADIDKILDSNIDSLDDWSREFMGSIEDQVIHEGRKLSEKQRDKVNELLDKLGL